MSAPRVEVNVETSRGLLTFERRGRPTTYSHEVSAILEMLTEVTEAVRRFYQETTDDQR